MTNTVEARHPNSRKDCWRNPPPNAAAARRRVQRIDDGEAQRSAEAAAWPGRRITQSELMLPLLQLLDEAGVSRPKDLYDELLRRLGVDPATRRETRTYKGQETVLFDRTVRWAMQEGKRQDLMAASSRGRWQATDKGLDTLGLVRPGVHLVVFRTGLGQAIAALAEEAAAVVDANSLQLLFTSPLFPILKGKSYGSMTPGEWLPWMLDMLDGWMPLIRDDGCIVVHLGQVHFRGMSAISSYQERFLLAAQDELGLYRQQGYLWEQPGRKANLEWGGVRGMLVNPTVDQLYCLSKSPTPYLSVSEVLVPYADPEDPRRGRIGHKEVRPSGLDFGPTSFTRDNGGARPPHLIRAAVPANDPWRRALRAAALPAHPCPMPLAVPRFVIRNTTRPGDRVGDFFFGGGTTGAAAEGIGRGWIGIDHHATFLEGAALRPEFVNATGYRRFPPIP